jgi:hypothetical protein
MPKQIVVTALGNRIEYATTNGKGLITGKREDITDEAISAVFTYLEKEFQRKNKEGKAFGTNFGELGKLMYLAPGTDIVWKEPQIKEEEENHEEL